MASRKYKVAFSKIAESDIDETLAYISYDLSNPDAASSFADELEHKLNEVSKTPRMGRLVENDFLKRDDVRSFLVGNFIVYYIVDEDEKVIVILRVVYEKRDLDKILKGV